MLSFYIIFSVCLATYTVNAANDAIPVNPNGLQKLQKTGNGNDGGQFRVNSMIENKRKGNMVGKNNVIGDIKMDDVLDKIKPLNSGSSTYWVNNLEKHQNDASDQTEVSAESNESSQSEESSESNEKLNIHNKQGKGNFKNFPTNPEQNLNGYNRYNMPNSRYGYPQSYGMSNLSLPPPPPPSHFSRYQQSYGAPPSPPPPSPYFSNNFQSSWIPPPQQHPMQSNGWNNLNSYGLNWQNNEDFRNQENVKRLSGNKRRRPNNIIQEGNPNSGMQSYNSDIPYNRYESYDNGNYGNNMYSPQSYLAPPSPMSPNGLNYYSNNQPKKNQYQNNPGKNMFKQYGDIVGSLTSKDDWYLKGKPSSKNPGGKVDINDSEFKLNGKKIPGVKANKGVIQYDEGTFKVNGDKKEGFDDIKGTGNLILEDNLNHGQDLTALSNKSRKITNQYQQFEVDKNGNINSFKTNNNNINSNKLPKGVTGMGGISMGSNGIKIGGLNGIEMGKNGIRIGKPNGGITIGA